MQKRGLASPDDGDALALTFAQPVAPVAPEEPPDDEDWVDDWSCSYNFGNHPGRWMCLRHGPSQQKAHVGVSLTPAPPS